VTSDARPTWTHPLFSNAVELQPAGEPGHFEGNVRLPAAGALPYAFVIGDEQSGSVGASAFGIRWEREVTIAVRRGVDWRRTVRLHSHPIDVPFS
jgi:hypothetical protein